MAEANELSGCPAGASTISQWEVQFSRFFIHPASPHSTRPCLVPLRFDTRKKQPRAGTWLSAASPATLQLLDFGSKGDAILTVYLKEMIMEEHFISKLHFTWPQVSCVSGFPNRGSRTVLVSYRDCANEIQKFALRFPTNYEAEAFLNALQENLSTGNAVAEIELPSPHAPSEISSTSEFGPSSTPPLRCQEEADIAAFSAKNELSTYQHENPKPTALPHDIVSPLAAYPPSFMSLLMSCQSEAVKAVTTPQPVLSPEARLRSQIMMYMEDSAFQEMLMTVEKIIGDMGIDFAL